MNPAATVDVVATWVHAGRLDRPPLVVLETLESYLDGAGLGGGPVHARPLGGGHSNATFLLQRAGAEVVLRRPPRPPLPPGAHDVVREARLLQALGPTAVPVPRVLAMCEQQGVIGAPFFLMEHVGGTVLERELPDALADPAAQAALGEAFIDVLADVHAVDLQAADLGWLARPTGYLVRQLRRFSDAWEMNRTRDLPAMAELEAWLRAHIPRSDETTLVHGDARLGNVLMRTGARPGIAALLDWEMATLGDPLADLGYLCAAWTDRTDVRVPMFHLSPATAAPGFPTRGELLDRYAARTGRSLDDLDWYRVLALWKSAVFMEGNYRRAALGMVDDPVLLGFADGVAELAELGLAAARGA